MDKTTNTTESGKSDRDHTGRNRRIPGMLLNEVVEVRVVVSRTRLLLQNIVRLAPASVIELDSGAAPQVEIAVNGRVIAWGEVVTVNGHYAVRMTRVLKRSRQTLGK